MTQITFGIITNVNDEIAREQHLPVVINSIEKFAPPGFEIVVVGASHYDDYYKSACYYNKMNHYRMIPFDESVCPGWITRKKNMITENATRDTIVYMHDYYELMPGWGPAFEAFEELHDYDLCMHRIVDRRGRRYRDWCAWNDPAYGTPWVQREPWCPPGGYRHRGRPCLVPYKYDRTNYMYISGGYWVARKAVMERFPLDERLLQAQAEDVEWSYRVLWNCLTNVYMMNRNCVVRILKDKDKILPEVNI